MNKKTTRDARKYTPTFLEIFLAVCILMVAQVTWQQSGASIFPHHPVRALASGVNNDMRNLATAVESYYIDFRTYPPAGDSLADLASDVEGDYPEGFRDFHTVPETLSTPVAYITNCLIADPFSGRKVRAIFGIEGWFTFKFVDHLPIAYTPLDNDQGFLFFSPGPDRDFDLEPEHFIDMPDDFFLENFDLIYDATNGTHSSGDLLRTRKGIVSGYWESWRSDSASTVSTQTESEPATASPAP